MNTDLETLIAACIERKVGTKDFALFYDGDGEWRAEIGNPLQLVRLGEVEGEYVGRGRTARSAVLDLEAILPKPGTGHE